MKKLFLITGVILAHAINAQPTNTPDKSAAFFSGIDTSITLDLLKAPSSPASSLLGIAVSDIDKPTDVSAFMLSLQSAANSVAKLPSNYAIDIAPFWLFGNTKEKRVNTHNLRSSYGPDVFKQTFVLSLAFKNPDSSETSFNYKTAYGGLGFKFSIFRGNYDAKTKEWLDKIKKLQNKKLKKLTLLQKQIEEDKLLISLENERDSLLNSVTNAQAKIDIIKHNQQYQQLDEAINNRTFILANDKIGRENKQELKNNLISETQEEINKEIKVLASEFQTARVGWTWDIAGGISSEFVDKRFDNAKLFNAGIWTNVGYTDEKYGAGLFLFRLLHNPDKIFAKNNAVRDTANITTCDFGGRYIFAAPQSKFSASVEYIYRGVLSSKIANSWRLVFNADYAIQANQRLTFSFGRNFDGIISRDNNLIAALSFLTGFGNKR